MIELNKTGLELAWVGFCILLASLWVHYFGNEDSTIRMMIYLTEIAGVIAGLVEINRLAGKPFIVFGKRFKIV